MIAPRAEMGQGEHTGLAMLVAEELGVTREDVTAPSISPRASCAAMSPVPAKER